MITLTRLDGRELVVNADHILTAEPTPDTVLLLSTGLKLMVREGIPEILDRVAAWKRRIGGCVSRPREVDHAEAEHIATVLSFPRTGPTED
jgi:flagellar protein FlbD